MKHQKLPKQISKETIKEALSDKDDYQISSLAAYLRYRFIKASFKELLGMSVKQAQNKLFK